MKLAPVVLFVYNRPFHTKQTVEALLKNELADESELFIYSDAPKNEEVQESVAEVRAYIKQIDGFKKVTIIEREKNLGLADSILDGVTKVVNMYGKVIVLEDDLVTSPYFLRFMNEALEFYKDKKRVWHISGWNYPIESGGLGDIFLWRVMNCWGWATWADRWNYLKKDVTKTINDFTTQEIYKFNLDGSYQFWKQVTDNHEGKINTWAIFWYATIFKNGGLCVNPVKTYVENIGLDGSGTHCGTDNSFSKPDHIDNKITFEKEITENSVAVERIKAFYKSQKKPLLRRIINKIVSTIYFMRKEYR